MKKLLLSTVFLCSCQSALEEKVMLYPAENCRLEFTACKRDVAAAEFAPGVCVHKDELYLYALQNPPCSYLKMGRLYLDSQVIDLDVCNLATPWVDKSDLSEDDVKLRKYMLGNTPFYSLKVYFCKGGANDYMVEWEVYKGKSVRVAIKSLNDGGDVEE